MEFTTCLELHSQATRLWGKLPPAERRPPYGPVTLFGNEAVFQRTWARTASARRRTSQTPHSPPPSRAGGSALSSSQFARRYYGNPLWFHFLRSMICLNSAGNLTQPEVEIREKRAKAPRLPWRRLPRPPPRPRSGTEAASWRTFEAGGRPPSEHQTAPRAGPPPPPRERGGETAGIGRAALRKLRGGSGGERDRREPGFAPGARRPPHPAKGEGRFPRGSIQPKARAQSGAASRQSPRPARGSAKRVSFDPQVGTALTREPGPQYAFDM